MHNYKFTIQKLLKSGIKYRKKCAVAHGKVNEFYNERFVICKFVTIRLPAGRQVFRKNEKGEVPWYPTLFVNPLCLMIQK